MDRARIARTFVDLRAEARQEGGEAMRYLLEDYLVSAVEIALETGCPGVGHFTALAADVWRQVGVHRREFHNDIRDGKGGD